MLTALLFLRYPRRNVLIISVFLLIYQQFRFNSAVSISGVIITNKYSAEIYLPSSGTFCTLPNLPDMRVEHTMDNDMACGGGDTPDTCIKFSQATGTWENLLTLNVRRTYHVSWTPAAGIGTFLIGGIGTAGGNSTTLIRPDGTQEPGFQLRYVPTMLVLNFFRVF